MNLAFDPSFSYIEKLRYHEDELGVVLKGHLIVEHILNQLILRELNDSSSIVTNSNQFTFAVKLRIAYSASLISEEAYRNILRINRLRNEFAHNFEPNLKKIDYLVSHTSESGEVFDLKAKVSYLKTQHKERKYLRALCLYTLTVLRNEWIARYGHADIQDLAP